MYNRLYNWQMQLQKEGKRMWRRMQCLNCTNINTVHDKGTEIDELVIEESQGHNNEINDEVEELIVHGACMAERDAHVLVKAAFLLVCL